MEYDAKTVDALKELMRIMQEHCVVSEADMLRIARNDRAYADSRVPKNGCGCTTQ